MDTDRASGSRREPHHVLTHGSKTLTTALCIQGLCAARSVLPSPSGG
jgi:hypothetical protein